jgi:hypothetical protein
MPDGTTPQLRIEDHNRRFAAQNRMDKVFGPTGRFMSWFCSYPSVLTRPTARLGIQGRRTLSGGFPKSGAAIDHNCVGRA